MTDRTISNAATLNGWRKSTYSNDQGGSCLEILDDYGCGIPVRDSKNPKGPALVFGSDGWSSFVTAIKQHLS
ncbi:DUF397 domain-containing protein [Streptomyces sp. NPDC055506]